MSRTNRTQSARRKTRALLGLCSDCLEPCVNGIRCERHLAMHRETDRRRKERKVQSRGFRYGRIPL